MKHEQQLESVLQQNDIFTKEWEEFISQFVNNQNEVDKRLIRDYWSQRWGQEKTWDSWLQSSENQLNSDLAINSESKSPDCWEWNKMSASQKLIRQLAKINSKNFDHFQSYEEIKNSLIVRIKAAKDLFDKSKDKDKESIDILDELNKCRYELFKIKLDELNKRDAKSDVKSLLNYFDDLTDKNYKLKALQMGLEEFVRQTNEECKELAHLFVYLWKEFQNEATVQVKKAFEQATELLSYLQKELKSSMKQSKLLEIKNKELIEKNIAQK